MPGLKLLYFLMPYHLLGAFALAIMMVNKMMYQNWYLASTYYYLHFQYNGWFFFGCMGLLSALIQSVQYFKKSTKQYLQNFCIAAVPAYFLSVLWMAIPLWVYTLVVVSAFAQVIAFAWLVKLIKEKWATMSGYYQRHR